MSWNEFPYEESMAEGIKGKGVWVYEPHMKTWFFVSPSAPDFQNKAENEMNNLKGAFINRLKPLEVLK